MFETIPYTFLEISRGGVIGQGIVSETVADGIFKLRTQLVRGENAETKDSNATLHIRPTESFLQTNSNLVGHGVRVNGVEYEIIGVTGGQNYHNGILEHYTATLQETDFNQEES
jgi:hypothetical protein